MHQNRYEDVSCEQAGTPQERSHYAGANHLLLTKVKMLNAKFKLLRAFATASLYLARNISVN